MTVLQAWLLVGVPALALALVLFTGSSRWRSLLGYVVLLAAFAVMVVVSPPSAAAIGGLVALLHAAGRGNQRDALPDVLTQTGVAAADAADVQVQGGELAPDASRPA